jgi:5'-phosphate synthase pdxT subunit
MVGILALQGDFLEHEVLLHTLHVRTKQVRLPADLEHVERLIIPGGESTTIGRLLVLYDLLEPIRKRAVSGMPLWGTCAGAILLAKQIAGGKDGQPALGLMDMTAERNAFGRQIDSFETDLAIPVLGSKPFHAVFIRAPRLQSPGKAVEVLARVGADTFVALRQDNLLATSFHPELSADPRLHKYFLSL